MPCPHTLSITTAAAMMCGCRKEESHGKRNRSAAENLPTNLSADFPQKFKPFPSFPPTHSGAKFGGSSGDNKVVPGTEAFDRRFDREDPLLALVKKREPRTRCCGDSKAAGP